MNLNDVQQKIINHKDGNIAVIATAGSGKTTVLTLRIQKLIEAGVKPENILAITFSRASCETMRTRLQGLLNESIVNHINIETFHSYALKIIQKFSHYKYTLFAEQWKKEQLIKDILISKRLCQKYDEDLPYGEIFLYFNMRKGNGNEYGVQWPYSKDTMGDIYDRYNSYKKEHDLLEFDDLVPFAVNILSKHEAVRKAYNEEIKYILADEFQDVSDDQAEFLRLLNTINTMIVGDSLQAIYSFRGGNSEYMLDFDQTYDNTTVYNLNTNYRCSDEIIEVANKFALTIPDSKHRNYVEPIGVNGAVQEVVYLKNSDQYKEAEQIVKKVLAYKDTDTMILARTNAQLQVLQVEFNKANINYDIAGGIAFNEQPEIKLLLSYLKLAENHNDNESFKYIYNKPLRWLSKQFLAETAQMADVKGLSLFNAMDAIKRRNWRFKNGIDELQEVITVLGRKRWKNIGEKIDWLRGRLEIDPLFKKGAMADDGQFGEKIDNMNAFAELCRNYKNIDELETALTKQDKNKEPANIHLSTIHKAKGLEADHIYIIGCNEGLLPHHRNSNTDDERRLMYVAITRAKKKLIISYSDMYIGSDHVGGRSSFIKDLTKN